MTDEVLGEAKPPVVQMPHVHIDTSGQIYRAINKHRDRRLTGHFIFDGVPYQFGPESKTRILGAGAQAGFAINNGAVPGDLHWHGGPNPFSWIAADNTIVQMDAHTAFAFGNAAADFETSVIFAARALKDMDPVPEDFYEDQYWPAESAL